MWISCTYWKTSSHYTFRKINSQVKDNIVVLLFTNLYWKRFYIYIKIDHLGALEILCSHVSGQKKICKFSILVNFCITSCAITLTLCCYSIEKLFYKNLMRDNLVELWSKRYKIKSFLYCLCLTFPLIFLEAITNLRNII